MATDTRTLRVVVVGDSTSAQRSIRDTGRAADELRVKASATQVALGTFAAMGASKLLELGSSAVTLGVKAASGMQQSQVAFTNMLGSGEKASAFLKDLQKLAATTPFELPDITRGAQRLMAMGIAAKDVIPTLTAAGDAVAAMGGSAEQVDQVTTALGQMQAKGKISGEELMQMTEAGIPALKILAAQYGKTVPEMQKMVSAGKVLSDDAIPKLVAGIENGTKTTQKFGGMMDAQSQTLAGKWSTLSDTVTQGLGNMFTKAMPQMNAGIDFLSKAATKVFSGISSSMGPAVAYIKGLFTDSIIPAAKSMWAVVGPLLIEFGNFLKSVWDKAQPLSALAGLFDGIKVAFGFIEKYKETFQTLAVGILAVVVAWKAWTTAVAIWSGVTKLAAAIQFAWNVVMAMNPIGAIILAIVGLVAAIAYAWTHFAGFRDFVMSVWGAIQAAAGAVAAWFMSYVWPTLVAVFNGIASAVGIVWTVISTVFNAVMAVASALVAFFTTFVWPVLKGIFDVIAVAVNVLATIFGIAFGIVRIAATALVYLFMNYVWPVLKSVFGFIADVVRALWSVFSNVFGWITDKVSTFANWFRSTMWPILSGAFGLISGAVKTLWDVFKTMFDFIKDKVDKVMNGAVDAFTNAKNKIGDVWHKLEEIAKAPVNFVIETVYNNGIRAFWNAIATKVGAKPLDHIDKLAAGREIPSVPGIAGDWVPFYGQAGEYVLNRRQVAQAGGRVGIESMFGPGDRSGASSGSYSAGGGIAHFGLGGLIGDAWGWVKKKATSLVKGSLLVVAKPLIDGIKAVIKLIPGTGDIPDLVRKVPTNALDSVLNWLRPKDKAPQDAALGGPVGAVGQIPMWVTAARDNSRFGTNSGVGLWLYNVVKTAGLAHSNQGIFNARRTATGNLSMHGYGRAVDLPASTAIFNFLRSHYGSWLKELIYSPAGGLQIYNGRNHLYTGITRKMHFNHVHASYDEGGILPPGTTIAHNNTGRNEYVMTGDQLANGAPQVTVNVTVQGNVTAERDLAESIATAVRDALIRKANRNGGRTGLM